MAGGIPMGAGGFSGLMKGATGVKTGGGLGKSLFGGLNAGQAIGGSLSGAGEGMMSGPFAKTYKGASEGGYDALMQGARLDHLGEGKNMDQMSGRDAFDAARQEMEMVRAKRMGPATGAGPMMGGQ